MQMQKLVSTNMFLVKCALYSSLFLSFEITVGGVIKHEVIDNTVSKFGDDFVLTRRSDIYGIAYNLVLTKEDDPLIFDKKIQAFLSLVSLPQKIKHLEQSKMNTFLVNFESET